MCFRNRLNKINKINRHFKTLTCVIAADCEQNIVSLRHVQSADVHAVQMSPECEADFSCWRRGGCYRGENELCHTSWIEVRRLRVHVETCDDDTV